MIKIREGNLLIDIDQINCSVDCTWNSWRSWSACDKTCGGGIHTRKRTKKVEEAYGGECQGKSTEEQMCSGQNCPGKISTNLFDTTCVLFANEIKTLSLNNS